MVRLARAQRSEINFRLSWFESNSEFWSRDEFREKVNGMKSFLKSQGVARESEYFRRLNELESKNLFSFENSNDENINFSKPKRVYSGFIDNKRILRVIPVYDHLFLSRIYGGKIKVSWRFNQSGRLDLIDSMIFPENRVYNILNVLDFQSGNKEKPNWGDNLARINEFPEEAVLINKGFGNLGNIEKYQSIARFGHSEASDLYGSLKSRRFNKLTNPRDGEKGIEDMFDDQEALALCQRASLLVPSIKRFDDKRVRIFYD